MRGDERRHECHHEARHDKPIGAQARKGQESKRDERQEIDGQDAAPDPGEEEAPGRDRGDRDQGERDRQEPGREEHEADDMAGGAAAARSCRYDSFLMNGRATRTLHRRPQTAGRHPGRPVPSAAWRDVEPDTLAPVILVAPGFLTMPAWYGDLAASLRQRGAADVLVAPVYLPDWVLAAARGLGPITTRVGRALLEAGSRSAECPASLGAPVLYVGHSAGGLIGRLLTSPVPFEGRTLNAAGRIGALVTLGTPNATLTERGGGRWGRRVGEAGARFAELHVPGAAFAPTTAYVSVASTLLVGRRETADARERFVRGLYDDVYPQPDLAAVAGDGLVPAAAALLPGSRQVALADAIHGPSRHVPWYGTDTSLDAWWPVALDAWREALRARQASEPASPWSPVRPGVAR